MTRLPVLPTVLVAMAVAAMVALGIWQLQRRGEKENMLALAASNVSRPAVAFAQPTFQYIKDLGLTPSNDLSLHCSCDSSMDHTKQFSGVGLLYSYFI